MNDNQEKNNSVEEEGNEPITKKIAKFSAFIYLGLAITVVIVATVGIFSVSYDYDESIEPVSLPEISFGGNLDITIPEIPENSISLPEISDAPVINEESDVDADVSMPEENLPVATYCRPVHGSTAKDFSIDALVYSETMQDYRAHTGIDIAAAEGTDVVCFTDGVVETVSDDYFFGRTVTVNHGNGMVSCYMNLDADLAAGIEAGATVKAGRKLGVVGNTAKCENADPAHLHFELRVNNALVDPAIYIPEYDEAFQ